MSELPSKEIVPISVLEALETVLLHADFRDEEAFHDFQNAIVAARKVVDDVEASLAAQQRATDEPPADQDEQADADKAFNFWWDNLTDPKMKNAYPAFIAGWAARKVLRPSPPPVPEQWLKVFAESLRLHGVPAEHLEVYDSNSWRRVGLAGTYKEVMYPCAAPDGHPDICGEGVLRVLVDAFNAMLEIQRRYSTATKGEGQ